MKYFPLPLLSLTLCLASCSPKTVPSTAEALTQKQAEFLTDVNAFCDTISDQYIYIDSRQENWDLACLNAKAALANTQNGQGRFRILENLLDVIYDNHSMLGANLDTSFKLIPSSADFWIEDAIISAVRPHSAAAQAGLRVGDEVITVNGKTLHALIESRLHPQGGIFSKEQKQWALISAAQGRRNETRSITVLRDGERLALPIGDTPEQDDRPIVEAKTLKGNIGYLKINNQLGNMDTVEAFHTALESLKGSDAWVLDLRHTPGGGGTDIAVPIMSRFVAADTPYQITVYKDKPAWVATSWESDKWRATGPMAVLVGRWTGSMGEGMAIGFDGMERATVIGTDMARLAGGVDGFTLPNSKINYQFPTYNLTHIDGTNRHEWSPPVYITSDNGDGPDLALQKATELLSAALNQ